MTDAPTPDAVPAPVDLASLFRLDGRTAIVTGASSGLGTRFARVLHAAGADVVLAARRLDRIEALAADLPGSVPVRCDVSVDAELEALVATTLERFGHIDVLVNNAGIGTPYPAEHETSEHFRSVVDVNLNATFVLSQLVARHMIEQRSGSIVNIASVLGLVGSAPIKQASYCASKGAVVNLTRELGAQWGRKGVRVNAIAPGWFPSEMTADMFADDGSVDWIARNTPMARGGLEQELDGALLLLASDASSYMTGHTLVVDGGWTAR
ncbi:MAG TPA: glucose 1-dehydrogenase [Acidimicrobiales bacterium]|nr:glucose 1-dehydrogenase [Acidimicrobiales bacterium]